MQRTCESSSGVNRRDPRITRLDDTYSDEEYYASFECEEDLALPVSYDCLDPTPDLTRAGPRGRQRAWSLPMIRPVGGDYETL